MRRGASAAQRPTAATANVLHVPTEAISTTRRTAWNAESRTSAVQGSGRGAGAGERGRSRVPGGARLERDEGRAPAAGSGDRVSSCPT